MNHKEVFKDREADAFRSFYEVKGCAAKKMHAHVGMNFGYEND